MTATLVEAHGTRASYRAGCHCGSCRAAEASYRATRRRSPKGYVAAGKVRTHIALLHDDGLSYREIARRAGVDPRTVQRIGNGVISTCTPTNRARILGVIPACGPARGVGWGTGDISVTTSTGFDDETIDEQDDDGLPTFDDPLASLRLLIGDTDELAWKSDGECARLEIPVARRQLWFFPMRGETPAPALSICSRCPVWAPCLQFAIDWNMEGIWGRSAGSHRRKLIHLRITTVELADAGMADDPDLSIPDAIERVVAAREAAA